MVVMLGVIAGLGFISLPSILAVPSPSSPTSRTTPSGANSTGGTTTSYTNCAGCVAGQSSNMTRIQLTNSTKTQATAPATITADAVSVLISLIFVPALALSWVATVLVSGRAS